MDSPLPIIVQDTREDAGTWSRWIGDRCTLVRGWDHAALKKPACLPTGDYCLHNAFSFEHYDPEQDDELGGCVVFTPHRLIERKTCSDLYGCCTSSRERFRAELIRILDLKLQHGTETQIVVECGWHEFLQYATIEHAMKEVAVRETIAAWQRRFCPIVFCGSERAAACYSFVFLAGAMQ
jgi:hypothetical protein